MYRFLVLVDTQRNCIVGSVCWSTGTLLHHFLAMIYPQESGRKSTASVSPLHIALQQVKGQRAEYIFSKCLNLKMMEEETEAQFCILEQAKVSHKADGPTPPKQS